MRIHALALVAALLTGSADAATAPKTFALPLTGDLSQTTSGAYDLDPTHTSVTWQVSHLGLSLYTARFDKAAGVLNFNSAKPELSSLDVTIDANSLSTGATAFDEQLKGAEYLGAIAHPQMRFRSTKIVRTGPRSGTMTGNFDFRGITKPVTLEVVWNGVADHPMLKRKWMGFTATGTLKRSEFGFGYGIPMVSDEVRFTIQTEVIHQP